MAVNPEDRFPRDEADLEHLCQNIPDFSQIYDKNKTVHPCVSRNFKSTL